MSTQPSVAPPGAPPVQAGGGGDGGGDHSLPGNVTVTRNMPPKRVLVLPGNSVNYGGHLYVGGEEGNDEFVSGEGSAMDGLALLGHVVILNPNATDEWNGKDGDVIRKRAVGHLDALAAAEPNDKTARDHDHGFQRYSGGDGIPQDLTVHRQGLAQQHMQHDRKMTDPEGEGKAPDLKAAYEPGDDRAVEADEDGGAE
jgi:hypothetical protein